MASPVNETEAFLKNIGKKLRRNAIGIDIISLGEAGNVEKLKSLVNSANNDDNSHFMHLESGVSV